MKVASRPVVARDVRRQFVWLADNASLEIAHQFRKAVRETVRHVGQYPRAGRLVLLVPAGEVRLIPVPKFGHLVLYSIDDDKVIVERLLHGAQDYTRYLHSTPSRAN